ncbi:MAG: DUF4956 domain-containing protein [Candidatus Neomarinimicrobiota bacterium]
MMDSSAVQNFSLFDNKVYDAHVWELIIGYGINFVVAFILIKLIYYRYWKNENYAFTYFMFNTLIFFVCYLLSSVQLSIGFAFGLFAVFTILRYRTDPIPIREMTYLFIVITVAVINAISGPIVSHLELFFTNFAIIALTFTLESYWHRFLLLERIIIYEKIENIKPENYRELMSDLRERTGLDIRRFEILRTDFLRDVARIKVYYADVNENE